MASWDPGWVLGFLDLQIYVVRACIHVTLKRPTEYLLKADGVPITDSELKSHHCRYLRSQCKVRFRALNWAMGFLEWFLLDKGSFNDPAYDMS